MTAYDAFTTETNDNSEDGSPIQPEPVRLFKLPGDAATMSAAITNVRDDARKTIASLSQNRVAFAASLEALEEPERVLVKQWMPAPAPPNARPSSTLPTQNLSQLTQSVRTTLAYFKEASPQHFHSEIKRFDEIDEYLRKREPQSPEDACRQSGGGGAEKREENGFSLRIFFAGLIVFLPSSDGTVLTVVLIDTPSDYALADGTTLLRHQPLLLARAASCRGTCSDDPASIARYFYPDKTPTQACLSLGGALLGGSAWHLSGAELSLEGPEGSLEIRTGARGRDQYGVLDRVPQTPAEREDFSWVADVSDLAPETDGYWASHLTAQYPGNWVAARLRLHSGKVFTYSVIKTDGKVRPIYFRAPSGKGAAAPYTQALANWVEATIHVPDNSVRIVERRLDGPARERAMQLYPKDGVVEIALLNLPPNLPPNEKANDQPQLCQPFEIYYEFLKTPPPPAQRMTPYVLPFRGSEPETDWNALHPRAALWSELLEQLGLGPRGKGPYDTALCPLTKD